MPVSGKVLEDSIRLSKIRRIKLTLYIVQTGALVGLAFFIVLLMGGARITPTLYLPIPSFIAVLILLLLIICIESFFFRVLEIRFARSSSARHLMAKNSIKRSLLIVIIAGVMAIVLAAPSILGVIENASASEVAATAFETPPSFYSPDALDLMSVTSVKIKAPEVIEVYLVKKEVFDSNKGDLAELYNLRINRPISQYVVDGDLTIIVPAGSYAKYYLIMNDLNDSGVSRGILATFTMLRSVSHTFTGIILLFTVAFVVSNVAWIAYLIPVERKYSAGSIYR